MPASVVTKTAKTADASPTTFPLAFLDLLGDASKLATLHALVNSGGVLIDPAKASDVQAVVSALGNVLNIAANSLPLPAGAATETTLAAQLVALNAIKAALLAQVDFETMFVTDGTNYYVRRESVAEGTGAVTVSFTNLAGAAASPVVANLTPIVGSSSGGSGGTTRTIETAFFDATASGTGITAGDVLARVIVFDLATNSIVASYWHNMMTAAAVTPAAGSYVEQVRNLAVGASTSAKQDAGNATLTQIDTDLNAGLGTDGTSPPALPGGATGVRGWLRYLASLFPASLGAKTAALSFPVALSTDGVIATAYGTQADTATPDPSAGGASFTFVSLFKGIATNGFALRSLLPASLGPKAKAAALAVTTATDDPALAAIAATGPGSDHFAITPTDTAATVFTVNARSIYVGVAGDVAVVSPGGSSAVVYKNVPAGQYLTIAAKRVAVTGTTAGSLVGLV